MVSSVPTVIMPLCGYLAKVTQPERSTTWDSNPLGLQSLWHYARILTPGSPVLHCLLEFAQTRVHWVGDAIQPPHPLSYLLLMPSIFPSIRVFSSESALHMRWPKYWSFSFSLSIEYSGLISFRSDWFDLLAVQGTLTSCLQHIIRKHQFFDAQPSLWSSSHIRMWFYYTGNAILLI